MSYIEIPGRPDSASLLEYGVLGAGVLLVSVGLQMSLGIVGVALGVGIGVVALVTIPAVGFALGQAGVATVISAGTELSVFALVEAGLVLTLFSSFTRISDPLQTFGFSTVFFLGFLGLFQIIRLQLDSLLVGAVTVICISGLVAYLIHRVESVEVDTITEETG